LFYKPKLVNTEVVNSSVFAKTLRIINPELTNLDETMLIEIFLLGDNNMSLADMILPDNVTVVNNALEKFAETYNSNNIIGPSFKDIKSKNIESGFISNTTNAINSVNTIVIVLSLLISITILVMISTLIISENERNVAIFSILGYSNIEKMKLFFLLYLPIIVIAILLSIPLSIGLISMFASVVSSSVLISLSISLGVTDVLLSSLIVLLIFAGTSTLS
jgi:putative ABC transport system permease protein